MLSLISTCRSLIAFSSDFIISEEWSLTGNTLFPLSILSFVPLFSTRFIISSFVKFLNALNKNLLLLTTFSITVFMSEAFVRLHLPLPVINIFLPSFSFFSSSITCFDVKAAEYAAIIPAAPPPIIITFAILRYRFYKHIIYSLYSCFKVIFLNAYNDIKL